MRQISMSARPRMAGAGPIPGGGAAGHRRGGGSGGGGGAAQVLPFIIVLFLVSAVAAFFVLPLDTFASPPLVPVPSSHSPVNVYMHQLPEKFTTGVIESYAASRGGGGGVTYPGHQHSGEWHLYRSLLSRQPNPYISVVSDPADADLFYVPFFSSLSLIVNPRPDSAGSTYSDEAMQEELVEWLEGNEWWKRKNGRDHVFVCQDPNALYHVIDRLRNSVLILSDFGRVRPDQASLVKDVIVPYSHRIRTYEGEVGVKGRDTMLFFMGNRYRKEGGKVRDILFQILEDEKDVVIKHGAQSRESRRMATQGMHSSKFCLHPAGDTPSACRLFDALVSLCIPVIVSDYIELPFEDVIDYRKLAIFVQTNKAVEPGFLISLLRSVNTDTILQYQQEIKKVKHYFDYDDPNGTVKEIWRQVALKLPLIKLMVNRDNRLIERGSNNTDCSCICSSATETVISR